MISIQGQRKYMEDTYQAIPNLEGHSNWSYYGVYDGHGGARCSVYVAHYLHKHVLAWIDAYIQHYSSNSKRLIDQLLQCTNNNNNNNNNDNGNSNTNSNVNGERPLTPNVMSNLSNCNSTSNVNQSQNESEISDPNQTILAPSGSLNHPEIGSEHQKKIQKERQLIRPHDADSIPQCIVRIMNEILLKVCSTRNVPGTCCERERVHITEYICFAMDFQ